MTKVKVYVIDEENEEYYSFSSSTDAATFLDVAPQGVTRSLKENRVIKGHYRFTTEKPTTMAKHVATTVKDDEEMIIQNRKYKARLDGFWSKQAEAIQRVKAAPTNERNKLIIAYNDWAKKNFPDINHDFISLFDI